MNAAPLVRYDKGMATPTKPQRRSPANPAGDPQGAPGDEIRPEELTPLGRRLVRLAMRARESGRVRLLSSQQIAAEIADLRGR